MRRFHIPPGTAESSAEVSLDSVQSHHITKVLRLKEGTGVELYDGTGFLYSGKITSIKRNVNVLVEDKTFIDSQKPDLILHCGLLKNKKMEQVIQKATELGVTELHLFTSEHTAVKPPNKKRIKRFEKIVTESCKQCERIRLMEIVAPTTFREQILDVANSNQSYLFWEREKDSDPSVVSNNTQDEPVHIFTGPEGGFSKTEIKELPDNIKKISLGTNILRAETAVLSGVSIINFLTGKCKP